MGTCTFSSTSLSLLGKVLFDHGGDDLFKVLLVQGGALFDALVDHGGDDPFAAPGPDAGTSELKSPGGRSSSTPPAPGPDAGTSELTSLSCLGLNGDDAPDVVAVVAAASAAAFATAFAAIVADDLVTAFALL